MACLCPITAPWNSVTEDGMSEDRERLRITFDEEAPLYDRARPDYPDRMFDDLVSLSGIPPDGRVLEMAGGVPFPTANQRLS